VHPGSRAPLLRLPPRRLVKPARPFSPPSAPVPDPRLLGRSPAPDAGPARPIARSAGAPGPRPPPERTPLPKLHTHPLVALAAPRLRFASGRCPAIPRPKPSVPARGRPGPRAPGGGKRGASRAAGGRCHEATEPVRIASPRPRPNTSPRDGPRGAPPVPRQATAPGRKIGPGGSDRRGTRERATTVGCPYRVALLSAAHRRIWACCAAFSPSPRLVSTRVRAFCASSRRPSWRPSLCPS